jgi:hypothetical protein
MALTLGLFRTNGGFQSLLFARRFSEPPPALKTPLVTRDVSIFENTNH